MFVQKSWSNWQQIANTKFAASHGWSSHRWLLYAGPIHCWLCLDAAAAVGIGKRQLVFSFVRWILIATVIWTILTEYLLTLPVQHVGYKILTSKYFCNNHQALTLVAGLACYSELLSLFKLLLTYLQLKPSIPNGPGIMNQTKKDIMVLGSEKPVPIHNRKWMTTYGFEVGKSCRASVWPQYRNEVSSRQVHHYISK